MGRTKKIQFVTLNVNHAEQVIKTIELFSSCFSDRKRYTVKRLTDELRPSQKLFTVNSLLLNHKATLWVRAASKR